MSTTLFSTAPVSGMPRPVRRGRARAVAALLVGLLGIGLAVALPLAPVVSDHTEVSWPAQGQQPRSTTAFFVPYRPAELHVQVPCHAVQAGLGAGHRTVLLATVLVKDGGVASGLVVDAVSGQLRVAVNGQIAASSAPPATGCDVRVDSDDTATRIAVGGSVPTVLHGEPVPEVFAFITDLSPDQATGTAVSARTRNWFSSSPSGVKIAMIVGYVAVALLALAMLARWTGTESRRAERPGAQRARHRSLRLAVDGAVVAVLALWLIIAPQTDDDGYATMTIRNALHSGDIGNYYHWFNASEAPFTLVQHVVQLFAAFSAAPLWLRLPSIVVGLIAWFVISRGVLGALLPSSHRGPLVSVLTAVCFLAWWLPFNTGLRPEPYVALGAAAVLALLLRATASTARRPLMLIGGAALVAGITASVTPSGMLALAPVLVLLPRIWRTVRGIDGAAPSWSATAGIVSLLVGLASCGLVLMFFDQSWHGVAEATRLHDEIGPSLKWYEEAIRYSALLGGGDQGTVTKRVAVLLTIALMLVAVPLLARGLPELRRFPDAHVLTGVVAASFGLLFLTPSKWSHHFGSVAGVGAPFLVLSCLMVVETARSRTRDRAVLVITMAGAGVVALAAGLAFAGPNSWFIYSSLSVSFRDRLVTPYGVQLSNPVVWLLVAAVVVGGAWWRLRRTPGSGVSSLSLAPAVVAVATATASVALLLIGFTVGPLRQATIGSYSLAAANLGTLTGTSCGIEDKVQVVLDSPDGPLAPAGTGAGDGSADGFTPGGGYYVGAPPPDAPGSGTARYLWGSLAGGEKTTGSLVSPWFTLPALTGDQDVAVSAAGRTGGANQLRLQFGRSEGADGGVTAVAERSIADGGGDHPSWRPLSVAADEVPRSADRVRVLATDGSTDLGGWLAVTGPRVRTVQSLHAWLADQGGLVLPDWPIAWHLPCVANVPVVEDGLAQTPNVILAAPHAYIAANIAYLDGQGGSFAGVGQADSVEVPSRLVGAPEEEWGHVIRLHYPMSRDNYDRKTTKVTQWGWQGDR